MLLHAATVCMIGIMELLGGLAKLIYFPFLLLYRGGRFILCKITSSSSHPTSQLSLLPAEESPGDEDDESLDEMKHGRTWLRGAYMICLMVMIALIVTNELAMQASRSLVQVGEEQWTFGQTLAIFLVFLPLKDVLAEIIGEEVKISFKTWRSQARQLLKVPARVLAAILVSITWVIWSPFIILYMLARGIELLIGLF